TELAVEILSQARKQGVRIGLAELRQQAWRHWARQIHFRGSDRCVIVRRLKALRARDRRLTGEYHRATVRSLELALVPSKAQAGSFEDLIDQLVGEPGRTGTFGTSSREKAYGTLRAQGFKAVPALIEALEDQRMTRQVMRGFNNFPTWNMRVQHVVSDLL